MKKTIALILLITYCVCGFTSPFAHQIPKLEFANLDKNRFIFPADSNNFAKLYKKMDRLFFDGEGHINIVHIGGSHIQAEVFTHRFRSNLLELAPGIVGGRGLIFPFSVARTNNPISFKTRYSGEWTSCRSVQRNLEQQLGLTGIAVTTYDKTASIQVALDKLLLFNDTIPFECNSVHLLGKADNNQIRPLIIIDNDTISGTPDKQQIGYLFTFPRYTDSLSIAFEWGGSGGSFTLTGILLENDLPGITCHGIGVNGASTSSYLRCDNFERDLSLIKPDLMIFSIGINDASGKDFNVEAFIDNYSLLIDKVLKINPDCALLFSTNNDSYVRYQRRRYRVNPKGKVVEDAFFVLAKKYNGSVWNLFDIMGGLESMRQWEKAGLAKQDKVHFTNQGYIVLGDLLFNAFIDEYAKHLEKEGKR